jgi:hypothetical protein
MWWAAVVSLVFVYPLVEMAEEWRLHRWARRDLAEMRRHAAAGHRWDVTRGQWVAFDADRSPPRIKSAAGFRLKKHS